MKKFSIDLPGIGGLGIGGQGNVELKGAARRSNEALTRLGGKAPRLHSFGVAEKSFCVDLAHDEAAVREHAKLSAFPANKINQVKNIIDPTTVG